MTNFDDAVAAAGTIEEVSAYPGRPKGALRRALEEHLEAGTGFKMVVAREESQQLVNRARNCAQAMGVGLRSRRLHGENGMTEVQLKPTYFKRPRKAKAIDLPEVDEDLTPAELSSLQTQEEDRAFTL